MSANGDKKRIELLEQRVEYLEEVNKATTEALELAASLGNFETSMSQLDSPENILRETCLRAKRLVKTEAQCIFLFSESDSDLEMGYCTPRHLATHFRNEVDNLVENGSLAWALDRNRPFFASSLLQDRSILLYSLATSSRIRGVYLGIMKGSVSELPDSMRLLFSIIMQRSANSLESYALYSLLRDVNAKLEEKIQGLADSEEALKEAHDWMRAIFDVIPIGMNIVDQQHRIIEVSDKLLDDYKVSRTQKVVGRYCFEVLKRRRSPCPECTVDRVLKRGTYSSRFSSDEENALTGKNFKIFTAPIPRGYKGRNAVAQFHLDVSDLRELEKALVQAKNEAVKASHAKSDFLASMSHEIRTPMNAIMGMTELALSTPLNSEQFEYLETITESAHHLLMLINDVLDFSKIEARKLELEVQPFDLHLVMRSVVRTLLSQARRKGLDLQLEISDSVPQAVMGDAGRLRQVLFNLLGNALKFSNEGTVRCRVQTVREGLDKDFWDANSLLISVADKGIGIPAEKQDSIFEEFTQADVSTTRGYGGTGLGLAISKHLVTLMGGRIWVESQPGKGSTFYVLAPFEKADPALLPKHAPDQPHTCRPLPNGPLKILLAEDNSVNARVATIFLERQGHHVCHAASGLEAMTHLAETGFDVVLMDLEMPDMDGLEATVRIRNGEAGTSATGVVIIAMTAHAMGGYREKCLQAQNADKPSPIGEGFLILSSC